MIKTSNPTESSGCKSPLKETNESTVDISTTNVSTHMTKQVRTDVSVEEEKGHQSESSEEETIEEKPAPKPPSKRFNAKALEHLKFQVKTDEDPLDANGVPIREYCKICKWYIEKGNYFMELACSHRFHKKCMEMQLLENSRCAVCSKEADIGDLF